MMAAAKIFILVFTIVIWEVNSQKSFGSIIANPSKTPCAGESPTYVNPMRPSLTEEESPINVSSLRHPFAKKQSFTITNKFPISGSKPSDISTPLFKGPSFSVTCTSSEPLLPLSVKTSLPNSSLDLITDNQCSLSNSGQNIISLSSKNPIKSYGPRVNVEINNLPLILPNPECNVPFKPNSNNILSASNAASACDCSPNIINIELPTLPSFVSPKPQTFVNRVPITSLIPPRSLTSILSGQNNNSPCYETLQSSLSSTGSVAEAASSVSSNSRQAASSASVTNIFRPEQIYQNPYFANTFGCPESDPTCSHTSIPPQTIAPCCQSSFNNADTSRSISSNLASSSSASSFSAGQVSSHLDNSYSLNLAPADKLQSYQPSGFMQASSIASSGINTNPAAPCSSNIFGCPTTDPTCSHTSVPPLTTVPFFQSLVNTADASSSASAGPSQAQVSPISYSSNIFGCPENPTCAYSFVPSLFTAPCYQPLFNTADASNSAFYDLGQGISSPSSVNSVLSTLNSPYFLNSPSVTSVTEVETISSIASGLGQASSSALSVNVIAGEVSPSSYSSNILDCPEIDPTSSFTCVPLVSPVPTYQSSVNIADESSSVLSGLGKATASSLSLNNNPFITGQRNCISTTPFSVNVGPVVLSSPFQSSVNLAEATSSIASGLGQTSSSASSVNVAAEQVNPNSYSSNTLYCPEIDPTCFFTSVPPVSTVPTYQSSVNIADASSSISSGLSQATASSLSLNNNPFIASKTNSLLLTPSSANVGPMVLCSPPQTSVNVAKATSSSVSGLGQSSSSASSVNVAATQVSPSLYSSNILGCPETDPTCSFTSIPPVLTVPTYQSSVNMVDTSSTASTSLGQTASSSSSNVNSLIVGQVNAVSPTSYTPYELTGALSTPSQSFINLDKSTSSVTSAVGQTASLASSVNVSENSVEATGLTSSSSAQAASFSTTTAATNPITETETASTIASVSESISNLAMTSAASSSATSDSSSEISSSSTSVSTAVSPVSTSFSASKATMISPPKTEGCLPEPQDNPSSVVETTTTSSITSSSPTNVLTSTSSSSSTTIDTANTAVKQSTPILPVQKTQTSTSTTSTSSTTVSTPTSLPLISPSTLALAVSTPLQNMFTMDINPLILEVEVPSSIRSSILSSNVPRSYGPHVLQIPSCLPAQLSCSLRSK